MNLSQLKSNYEAFLLHRRAFDPGAKSWYRMEASQNVAEVYIYDAIGMFGVEADAFVQDLQKISAKEITLRISSPGGSVFEGTAIYNALLRHPATVNVKIDSLAGSMASVIALAGDTVEIAQNAFYMIHMPFGVAVGTSDEMRAQADLLDKLGEQAVSVYEKNSNLSSEEIIEAMEAETWYTAEEALEAGFVDSIFTGQGEEMKFDLSVFAKAPSQASQPKERTADPRGLEEVLRRDVGMSQREAKEYIAAYNQQRDAAGDHQRDADGELDRLINGLNKSISQLSNKGN